ncbi:hypothetical protein Pmani_018187, partial [Petrolisthes manimaculis]
GIWQHCIWQHFADKTKYWREFEEDGDQMNNLIGVGETLLISCVNGLLFALFTCQPLLNVGATGPLMIFYMSLYHFAKTYELDFLSLRVWIGVWMTVFGLLVATFEAVAIVMKFTRFTEEIFSTLVCLIFIYESFVKLIAIFQTHPLISEYVIMGGSVWCGGMGCTAEEVRTLLSAFKTLLHRLRTQTRNTMVLSFLVGRSNVQVHPGVPQVHLHSPNVTLTPPSSKWYVLWI